MKHRKIEKIILNFFRLLPILCILIFLLYVCLTGFKKEKTNTYDTTNIEQITEEDTIYTYELDDITITTESFDIAYDFWSLTSDTEIYLLMDTDYITNGYYIYLFFEDKGDYDYIGVDENSYELLFLVELLPSYSYGFCDIVTIDGLYYFHYSSFNFTAISNRLNRDFDSSNVLENYGYYSQLSTTETYTDNYTIVNKIKYYMNDYVFQYTDTLFNSGINTPFNAFANAISLNENSIFYSYLKFSYLYLIYLLLIDFIYLFYNIIAFIPKWLVNEFEKRT